MICPSCEVDALRVRGHIELGRMGAAHENTVQRGACDACRAVFLCVYSEERSVSMNRDNRVSHSAYRVNRVLWWAVAIAFEHPKPKLSADWRRRVGRWLHVRCNYQTKVGPIAVKGRAGDARLANADRE